MPDYFSVLAATAKSFFVVIVTVAMSIVARAVLIWPVLIHYAKLGDLSTHKAAALMLGTVVDEFPFYRPA